jgi:hypothetical protein
MSLEQYKDANRKELWEILQIQVGRIAELEKGYEELRMATLWAVQLMGGGQAKADLRDAYDNATEQLEKLKETK